MATTNSGPGGEASSGESVISSGNAQGDRKNDAAGFRECAMSERDLFIAALERDDPAERDAYVAQACGSDADLRRRVERLLRLHGEAGSFLEPPPAAPGETL